MLPVLIRRNYCEAIHYGSSRVAAIAEAPPLHDIPHDQPAVSDALRFDVTLCGELSGGQLATVAQSSMVEFGSDRRYLFVPEPTGLLLGLVALCRGAVRI